MIPYWGIEPNPEKVQAIINMRFQHQSDFSFVQAINPYIPCSYKEVSKVPMEGRISEGVYGFKVIPVCPTNLGLSEGKFTLYFVLSSL